MFYVALIVLIAFSIWFWLTGLWYLIPVLYLVAGVIWSTFELRRPPLYRSMAYMSLPGTIFIVILWPMRVISDLLDTAKLRRSPERYVVAGDGNIKKFGRWDEAVHVAKDEAKITKERIMVSDTATFSKQLGRVQHKSWFVDHDGSVELLPR